MTSGTLIGWRPTAPTAFAQPVLDENAEAAPLCGAELPDGTGCLVWANGSNVRYAHTADTASWLVDDSVPTSDMATAVATGGTILGTTVFMGGGYLNLLVGYLSSGGNNVLALYRANSATAPSSWSLVSTIWNQSVTGGGFGESSGIGHPLILDSGRWVLATKVTWSPDPSFHQTEMHVFTTDNDGSSWTDRYTYSHPYPGFGRTEFAGAHVGYDPATGDLWFMSGTSISFVEYQIALHQSTDDGVTWSIPHATGMIYTDPRPIPCIDTSTDLWAIDEIYLSFRRFLSGSDGYPSNTNWISDGVAWTAPGVDVTGGSAVMRAIVAPLAAGVFFFVRDQVMFVGRPNQWTVGRVLMGNRGNPWR